MSKISKVFTGLLGDAIMGGGGDAAPAPAPAPLPAPAVMPDPDDAAVKKAKKKQTAEMLARAGGRVSTFLFDSGSNDTLG